MSSLSPAPPCLSKQRRTINNFFLRSSTLPTEQNTIKWCQHQHQLLFEGSERTFVWGRPFVPPSVRHQSLVSWMQTLTEFSVLFVVQDEPVPEERPHLDTRFDGRFRRLHSFLGDGSDGRRGRRRRRSGRRRRRRRPPVRTALSSQAWGTKE